MVKYIMRTLHMNSELNKIAWLILALAKIGLASRAFSKVKRLNGISKNTTVGIPSSIK